MYRLVLISLLLMARPAIALNVLLIVADDLGWQDVGYNGSEIRTPNIDRLAGSGLRLDRFYTQPTCSPTRASLMTGQSALRHGVLLPLDKNNMQGLPPHLPIMPGYFLDEGYQTALVGKWHLGHAYRDLLPMSRGFEHVYGHLLGGVGHWDHIHGGGLDWQRNGTAVREEGYTTHLLAAELTRRIRDRDPDRPFFYMLNFAAPHLPNEAPECTVAAYEGVADPDRQRHAAMVDEVDRAIGRVVDVLEHEGLSDDTLIWFMSDNGGLIKGTGSERIDGFVESLVDWFGEPLPLEALEFVRSNIQDGGSSNGPLPHGKGSVREGGVRVPSFIYLPGTLEAGVIDHRISVQDVLPSVLAAAGLEVAAESFDGQDQWPALLGRTAPSSSDWVTTGVDGEAYYRGPWKLRASGDEHYLFNLEEDPYETANLTERYPDRVAELDAALKAHPRGESIHQTSWWDIFWDPDRFGGEEDRGPWIEQVRDR